MEERLTILKNLRDKRARLMNINLEIYRAFRNKTNFPQFLLSTGDPINGWRGYTVQKFLNLRV